jgi:hypothetical protein
MPLVSGNALSLWTSGQELGRVLLVSGRVRVAGVTIKPADIGKLPSVTVMNSLKLW